MWTVCITSVSHVLKVNEYGGRQAKVNEKRQCFKGWETLVNKLSATKKVSFFHSDYSKWSFYYNAD